MLQIKALDCIRREVNYIKIISRGKWKEKWGIDSNIITKLYIAPQNILESERVLIQRYNIQKEQAVQRVDEFPKEKH